MSVIHSIWAVLAAILALNMPFGYWRAGVRKFSLVWFIAVHAPVVLAIAVRFAAGIPFRFVTLPLFVGAFFVGQMAGGRLRVRSVEGA